MLKKDIYIFNIVLNTKSLNSQNFKKEPILYFKECKNIMKYVIWTLKLLFVS